MPGTASPRDAIAALQKGRNEPVYLLLGDDEQGKAPLMEALSSLVEEDLRGFNLQRFYANENEIADIVAAARTLPFMGGRRVIFVLRGEAILKPKGRAGGRADPSDEAEDAPGGVQAGPAEGEADTPDDITLLEEYLNAPSADTCLVLVAADLHRGTRIGKLVLQRARVVEFWGFKREREARSGAAVGNARREADRYVEQRVREAKLTIDADGVDRLLDHAGTDISVLRGDLERVLTFCAGRNRIADEDVKAVVGGAVSHDDWAILRAIERGDARGALRQLALMLEGGASPYQVLGQIGYFVRSSLPASASRAVPAAVNEVFETDLALKTSRGDPQVLLERLIVRLCGGEERRRATWARPVRGA